MIPCWEIDNNGNIIEHYIWTQEEINEARANGRHIIDFPWTQDEVTYQPKFDLENNKWVEGYTSDQILDFLKKEKMTELGSLCTETIYGRFTSVYNGVTYSFSCDSEAQSNFEKVDRAFEKGRITSIAWTAYDADGNVCRLLYDATSFETLYVDHLSHIQSNISKFRDTLVPQVMSANSKADLDKIVW